METNVISMESVNGVMENDSRLFDFEKEKVQELTLDQLERTHKENDVYGNPIRGIYHYELLNNVLGMCRDQGYDVEVYDLFAAQNKDRNSPGVVLLPQVEAQFGERAVEAHILRRVYANIRIKDFDDEETTTNLAVAFHQRGIQVGFGPNVMICHNQCMLNRDRFVSTYSEKGTGRGNGVTIPELLDVVRSWLVDARKIVVSDRERMNRMKSYVMSAEQMFTMIGMLQAIRVSVDSKAKVLKKEKESVYPLNQAQISQFTESLLIKKAMGETITLWDVYNAATDLYKANTMDIPNIMPQNRAMVEFLAGNYGV